jgi:glucose-1-phosphate thymidylyltransferase
MTAPPAPVGIVPAAGHARRLQPLSCSKEMLLVGGRPVIDSLLERMAAAACREIRVVTRPDKRDVAEHARACGATVVLARPATVSASLLAGLDDLDAETPVLFGFPDTIWGPIDGFVALLAALASGAEVALGIFRGESPRRSDVVLMEGEHVTAIHVKPQEPPSELVWGCAATRAGVLRGVAGWAEPGDYFDTLARQGLVRGIRLEDPFVDIGTPASLRRAGATETGPSPGPPGPAVSGGGAE